MSTATAKSNKLVTASVVAKELGIPFWAVYTMVERRQIPFEDVTQPFHQKKQYRFDLEAVRAAYAELARRRSA